MSYFAFVLIILIALLVDVYWLDVNGKRWGWMKNWSKLNKTLFFSGIIIVSALIYFAFGAKYLN
ncbi:MULTISPECIES: hypothetical protein [Bacillaceae]|jgi:hypothetical protein|uniref:hypothetical protein n=1 Tax=Bacillaceae TaxID=186817 RepID=UPI00242BAFC1|nr:hypothetical protein [Heyndrickxia oleronia]MCI1590278.1 hypothetical protein [Heyndrickxia oleronia]MCI1614060.1 hypothetical protein [Heyndrickxia oleronia]MCI1744287.1 hypothetical protein [Heyndrickxia oleronia]MCI1761922.1 hypothetical protein [Heyndrickxia oleronia]